MAMTRGEAEKRALEVAKVVFLGNDGLSLSSEGMASCYGFSRDDAEEFSNALATAKEQEDNNLFPDFVAADGAIIEHYRISSSKTTSGGQRHKKEQAGTNARHTAECERVSSESEKNPGAAVTGETIFHYPEHSHAYLLESLKRVTENHLRKLEQYRSQVDVRIAIFLIEYDELALSMIENVCTEQMEGRCFGDLQRQESVNGYKLSRDRKALQWLCQYSDVLDYVVLITPFWAEAIKLSEIGGILRLLPYEYAVAANGGTIERRFVACTTIPASGTQEDAADEVRNTSESENDG